MLRSILQRRSRLVGSSVPALLAGLVVALPAAPASAAQTIGYPTFTGPSIPAPPVAYNTGSTMQAIYNAESGGTDFWMDRLLARSGDDPAGTWLMTRGRAAYMYTHDPNVIGFGGNAAYWDNISSQNAYAITFGSATFTEQPAQRWQAPSYWKGVYTSGSLRAGVTKFITQNNVAVTNLTLTNNGSSSVTLALRVTSPYATTTGSGELTGSRAVKNSLTTIRPRLSGDGFTASSGALTQSVTLSPGQSVSTKVQLGFVTDELPDSLTEYTTYRGYSPSTAFATHVRAYNAWWADNIPYIDVPEPAIKKNVYYRWWLMRFNYLDADIPGQDFQFPTSVEGALGYNNAIVLTQPMHIDDLKYLRNPVWSYGPWLSVGQVSGQGKFTDNPGDPANWSNSYTQYIADAAWRSYELHGGQPGIATTLARYAEGDAKGQLAAYDSNGNGVIEYDNGAMTGNDADAVSFAYASGKLERAETAYVWAAAVAAQQAYALTGNSAKASEMQTLADRIKSGVVSTLWNPSRQLLEHRVVATNAFNPWKEINNYYPFSVGLMPNTDEYRQALRLFADPAHYPVFPFYTADQTDKAAAAAAGSPGSNNFSTINSTVQFRLLSSVLRNYQNQWITADLYKQLLYWNTWAQNIGGSTAWPDANEFWANWNSSTGTIDYRSWIHHNILGSSNWTVVEDVAGLRTRSDNTIELWPIDVKWPNFAVNNLRYRNMDLSIVWDDPSDGVTKYSGVPQGYSVYLNGNRAFTVDRLTHVLYNPSTGTVSFPGGSGSTTYSTSVAGLQLPQDVAYTDSRMVDMLAKAGVDLTSTATNLALGSSTSASYTASGTSTGAAVDGLPTNAPIWGSSGSANTTDWYQLDFGQTRSVSEVRAYIRDDRAGGRYRAPASYTVQYWDGAAWVATGSQQRTPGTPRANYNLDQFTPVSTSRLRIVFTHASGYRTGLTEFQAFGKSTPTTTTTTSSTTTTTTTTTTRPTTTTTTTSRPTTTMTTTTRPTTTTTTTTTRPTTTTMTTTTTGSSSTCAASLSVASSWPGGFVANVNVTAGSVALNGWKVTLTLPSGTSITNLWNGRADGATGTVQVTDAGYNATVSAGQSAQFGFQGAGSVTGTTVVCG